MVTEHLTVWTAIKNIGYVAAFIASVEWFGFQPLTLNILVVLMVIDVMTGIIRSCITEGCQSIKSSIGIHGVLSKLLVLTGIFSIALTAKALGFAVQDLVQGAVTLFLLSETYSIIGNIHSAKTGKPKVEFDAVAFLLKRVKELLLKYLEK